MNHIILLLAAERQRQWDRKKKHLKQMEIIFLLDTFLKEDTEYKFFPLVLLLVTAWSD